MQELPPSIQLKSHRPIHERPISHIFIHNQSSEEGDKDPDTHTVPLGQAADANAICLATKHDILVTSLAIDQNYLDYFTKILRISVPNIFVAKKFNTNLLQSVIDSKDELVAFIKEKQEQGIVKKKLQMSVFEADERDIELLAALQNAGLGDSLTSECNYDLLELGSKDGFRSFCSKHEITQLPGGTFKSVEELEQFILKQHEEGHTVVVKSIHGIGGGGQMRLRPSSTDEGEKLKKEEKETIEKWIRTNKAVEAEQFAESPESEHVVDIFIDPSENHHNAVLFDQIVKSNDDSAGMAYYGAKYPSKNEEAKNTIMQQVDSVIAPRLHEAGYRGPAGIDVLWKPLHFMELNMRTDAITYIKHLTDRVGYHLYNSEPGTTAFMTLVNLELPLSLSELLSKHRDVFEKKEDGIFALTNPNKQRWNFFDVVAISPHDLATAEKIMNRSLVAIWGEQKGNEILNKIYHPHPRLIPEHSKNKKST